MEAVDFIQNDKHAYERAEQIRTILRELREGGYIDHLGRCLDVGSSSGQGCYVLKQEGAYEVYGIEPNINELLRSIKLGFVDRTHVYPLRMEDLPWAHTEGLFEGKLFDTVTCFCFPYLPLRYRDRLESLEPEIHFTPQQIEKILHHYTRVSPEKAN